MHPTPMLIQMWLKSAKHLQSSVISLAITSITSEAQALERRYPF